MPTIPTIPTIPAQVRSNLADSVEEIGQALGLLREADSDITAGNPDGARLCASDALEILFNIGEQITSMATHLALFSESADPSSTDH